MAEETVAGLLPTLYLELTQALLKRVRDGAATAADLNVARQLLKDSGIEIDRNYKPKQVADLETALAELDLEELPPN